MKTLTLTLTKNECNMPLYNIFSKIFGLLFILNLKMGWLNEYHNNVYDDYDIIDTLGNSGDTGKFIETYSCELYYRQTIKTRLFTINIIDL